MASSIFFCSFALLAFLSLLNPCASFSPKLSFNISTAGNDWFPARATWYGPPNGAGTDGGACGYGDSVENPPYSKFIAAGNPTLFNGGKECGACYQVRCNGNGACSGDPVTVTITDSCPGGPCAAVPIHFDLSGSAFGAMAKPGQADQLRNAGLIDIQYQRVPCSYRGFHVAVRVDPGSNPYYFATIVEYEGGDGDLAGVDLQEAGSDSWQPMSRSWGAVWQLNSGWALKAPFSLRLTTIRTNHLTVAKNVIPAGWKPGATYWSLIWENY